MKAENISLNRPLKDEQEAASVLVRLDFLLRSETIYNLPLYEFTGMTGHAMDAITGGRISLETGLLLLEGAVDAADFALGTQDLTTPARISQAICDRLPATGDTSRAIYEEICFPFPSFKGDKCSELLPKLGRLAGHSWPQAAAILEGLTWNSKDVLRYQYIPSLNLSSRYTHRAWAVYLESLDSGLRADLVSLAETTGLRGTSLLLAAVEALGVDNELLNADPVALYEQKTGVKAPGILEDITNQCELDVAWCENAENEKLPGYGMVVRKKLVDLRRGLWLLDEWFSREHEWVPRPQEEKDSWNTKVSDWTARLLNVVRRHPEHASLWANELEYTSMALAGETILPADRDHAVTGARAEAFLQNLPEPLDSPSRHFFYSYASVLVPAEHERLPRASSVLIDGMVERLAPDKAEAWLARLVRMPNEDYHNALLYMYAALKEGEAEFLKEAQKQLGINARNRDTEEPGIIIYGLR